MDNKILEKANQINESIRGIGNTITEMDEDSTYGHHYHYYWPQELKDQVRPILKAYQEKLFKELKNL